MGEENRRVSSALVSAGLIVGLAWAATPALAQETVPAEGAPAAVADAQVAVVTIQAAALADRIETGSAPFVLDVRTPEEFAQGHIPGAVNIPHTELAERISELGIERSDEIIVYCRTGRRAGVAEELLLEAGFTKVADLEGHMQQWLSDKRPVAN